MASSIERLHALVTSLSKNCSKETAVSLKEVIPSVDKMILQKLHTYILVPLLGELSNTSCKREVKKDLLDSVNEVLTRVQLNDVSVVKNILMMLMMEIFDKDSPNMIKDVPEELKLNVMNCSLATVRNMPNDIQEKFYVKENIPYICQIAYTCLQLAESEKLRTLRIRAMEVVLALLQVPLHGEDKRAPWERQEIGDIFQFILPGATSKLFTIVSGDVTQGSKVLSTAIFALSSMIAVVMEDYNLSASGADNIPELMASLVKMSADSAQNIEALNMPDNLPRNAEGMKKLIDTSKGRTLDWRKKICVHLVPYLAKIAAHYEHSEVKVCKVVAQSCFVLLLRCPVSLKEGLPPLLDSLVALSVHEDPEVRLESNSYLLQLNTYFSERDHYSFIQLAEENFYMFLTRLPHIVQGEGGGRGASSVVLLSGYVSLLRSSMRNVLSSSAHLQRLTLSLLHVITLECSNISVSNEHSMRHLSPERCNDIYVPWTHLRFSSDKAVLSNIQQLCDIIADNSLGIFEIFASQLMDSFCDVSHFKKESALLLNVLLISGCKMENNSVKNIASSLLELYLATESWPSKDQSTSVTSIVKLQQDICLICLLTEGIGCCVYAVGKDKAQILLLRTLYPLLEQAGSANGCISLAGRRAITRVAEACGFKSNIIDLISKNMDYLSHCMSIRIRHSDDRNVFDALSLILHHSTPEIALGLYNIVLNVLHQSSETTQTKNNEAHLRVFLTFALGVCQWLNPKANIDMGAEEVNEGISETLLHESLSLHPLQSFSNHVKWNTVEKLKAYLHNVKLETMDEETMEQLSSDPSNEFLDDFQSSIGAQNEQPGDEMDDNSNEKEELPELAKLLVLVLKRCLHFLPCQSTEHQFLALRTLEVGLQALEPFTNTLLPIVHQVWSPLVGRFEISQPPLIVRTAFKLLQRMAYLAKDFLMSRTRSEVIPKLTKFLESAVSDSNLKDQGSVYRFSQKYKAQLSLLSGLGPLVCHLQFRGHDFHELLSVALLYLSRFQPRPLQVASMSFIQSVYKLDADAVWWALVTWWTPPHMAESLRLPLPSSHQDSEDNVQFLLQLLSATDKGRNEKTPT